MKENISTGGCLVLVGVNKIVLLWLHTCNFMKCVDSSEGINDIVYSWYIAISTALSLTNLKLVAIFHPLCFFSGKQ